MKKILVSLLLLSFLLSGCEFTAQLVHLDTEAEVLKYAQKHYGDAEILFSEISDTSHKYYFADAELGFEYYVESYCKPMYVDNQVFGYIEDKQSNFEFAYREFLWNRLNIDHMPDGVTLKLYTGSPNTTHGGTMGYIIVPDDIEPQTRKAFLLTVATQLTQRDQRGFLHQYIVILQDQSGQVLDTAEI